MTSPLTIVDEIMHLRGKSWQLSKKEDDLLSEIHSLILYRSEIDKEVDRLETRLTDWKKEHREPEPSGFFGWSK